MNLPFHICHEAKFCETCFSSISVANLRATKWTQGQILDLEWNEKMISGA